MANQMPAHPNVVGFRFARSDHDQELVFSELVNGSTLRAVLKARGLETAEEAISVALQLAYGLSALHRHGLVHGDVHAGNALVSLKGGVKLCDFGHARFVNADSEEHDRARWEELATDLFVTAAGRDKTTDKFLREAVEAAGSATLEAAMSRLQDLHERVGGDSGVPPTGAAKSKHRALVRMTAAGETWQAGAAWMAKLNLKPRPQRRASTDYAKAVEDLRCYALAHRRLQALGELDDCSAKGRIATLLVERSRLFEWLDDFGAAHRDCQRAIELFEAMDDKQGMAEALCAEGLRCVRARNLTGAEHVLRQAISIAESSNLARCYDAMTAALGYQAKWEDAYQTAASASTRWERLLQQSPGDQRIALRHASALHNKAQVLIARGKPTEALNSLKPVVAKLRTLSAAGTEALWHSASAHGALGKVFRLLRQYDEALKEYGRAKELYRQLEDQGRKGATEALANVLQWEAIVFQQSGKYSDARRCIEYAIDILDELVQLRGRADVELDLARFLITAGDFLSRFPGVSLFEAVPYGRRAAAVLRRLVEEFDRPDLAGELGVATALVAQHEELLGNHDKADELLADFLSNTAHIVAESGVLGLRQVATAYHLHAQTLHALERRNEALSSVRKAIDFLRKYEEASGSAASLEQSCALATLSEILLDDQAASADAYAEACNAVALLETVDGTSGALDEAMAFTLLARSVATPDARDAEALKSFEAALNRCGGNLPSANLRGLWGEIRFRRAQRHVRFKRWDAALEDARAAVKALEDEFACTKRARTKELLIRARQLDSECCGLSKDET